MKFSRNRFLYFAASAFTLALALTVSSPTNAQNSAPRLEPAECPFERGDWARDAKIECRWLVVPETRGDPKSRTIKLAVVVFRARQPDGTPPLVMLHGGPGDSGIRAFGRLNGEIVLLSAAGQGGMHNIWRKELRADRRYQDILRRVGLPADEIADPVDHRPHL